MNKVKLIYDMKCFHPYDYYLGKKFIALLIRVTENMVIFESGLPRGRNDTISITDDNPKIWWQSNEVYSWPQPPLISHRKCTGRILASAASYLL